MAGWGALLTRFAAVRARQVHPQAQVDLMQGVIWSLWTARAVRQCFQRLANISKRLKRLYISQNHCKALASLLKHLQFYKPAESYSTLHWAEYSVTNTAREQGL